MADGLANTALEQVASLAELAANQRGVSLVGSDLRLFENRVGVAASDIDANTQISPFMLGRTYELALAPTARRKTGAHLTPEAVARNLLAMMAPPAAGDTVLDPSVGGAAFLIAAADQLVAAGAAPLAVLSQLAGVDIDAGAVAIAEVALAIWGLDHQVEVRALSGIHHGDGLLDPLPRADRVVGNPPFLNQLRSSSAHSADRRVALREKWGDLVGAYTDDAWLFLAAGLDAACDQGQLAMVQPVSVLAARHGESVRRHIGERASLTGLWLARDRVFDAAVQVCGVVLDRGSDGHDHVERRVGADFAPAPRRSSQPTAQQWGSAAATLLAVPDVDLVGRTSATIADRATATAGFRDQFYGFVPFVSESSSDDVDSSHAKLITVGMIDVMHLGWGERNYKFAKQSFTRPTIDLGALAANDPKLNDWVAARRRPKVVMATQTRVVEVWVDTDGVVVPATPVLSIEPHSENPEELWLLAAALSAPAVSAHLLAVNFGTAMSLNAMKVAARDVLQLPLPIETGAWREAAELLRDAPHELADFAALMGRAYGVQDPALVAWWLGRLPNRTE